MRRIAAVGVIGFMWGVLGCGGPSAGEPCGKQGYACANPASALECRGGKWVSLPCRGSQGCGRSGNDISCDITGNQLGDACASSQEGRGMCSTDGMATLECRDGMLIKTNTCQSCRVDTTQNRVICQ